MEVFKLSDDVKNIKKILFELTNWKNEIFSA